MRDTRFTQQNLARSNAFSDITAVRIVVLGTVLVLGSVTFARRLAAQEYSARPISIDELLAQDLTFQAANPDAAASPITSSFVTRFYELANRLHRQGRDLEIIQIAEELDEQLQTNLNLTSNRLYFDNQTNRRLMMAKELSRAYCQVGQYEKAIQHCRNVIRAAEESDDRRAEELLDAMGMIDSVYAFLAGSLLEQDQIDLAEAQLDELDRRLKAMPDRIAQLLQGFELKETREHYRNGHLGARAESQRQAQALRAFVALRKGEREKALELASELNAQKPADAIGLANPMVAMSQELPWMCRVGERDVEDSLQDMFQLRKTRWQQLDGVDSSRSLIDRQTKFGFVPNGYFPWSLLSKTTDKASWKQAFEWHLNTKNEVVRDQWLRIQRLRSFFDEPSRFGEYRDYQAHMLRDTDSASRSPETRFTPSAGVRFTAYTAHKLENVLNVAGVASSLAMLKKSEQSALDHRIRQDAMDATIDELLDSIGTYVTSPGVQDQPRDQAVPWIAADAFLAELPQGLALVDLLRHPVFDFEALDRGVFQWLPDRYSAFIVSRDRGIRWVEIGDAETIDQAISQALLDLRRPCESLSPSLRNLSALLLGSVETSLQDVKFDELVISPDSQLWLVPWAALTQSNGKFVVESYRVRYTDSGRGVVSTSQAAENLQTNPPTIFADPDFDLSATDLLDHEKKELDKAQTSLVQVQLLNHDSILPAVQRLPFTRIEASYVSKALQQFTGRAPQVYLDRDAFEARMARVERPVVLVMSTHGFFLGDVNSSQHGPVAGAEREQSSKDDSLGAVALRGLTDSRQILPGDPLYRCGLLLAGCNESHNWSHLRAADGILTGKEIVHLDLRGTKLVVLSACDTGIGEIRNGRGVASLRQAFQIAGAENVVATLWQVDDKETARLMVKMFEFLSAGHSYSDALQDAQVERIVSRRQKYGFADPYYWASFTLTN